MGLVRYRILRGHHVQTERNKDGQLVRVKYGPAHSKANVRHEIVLPDGSHTREKYRDIKGAKLEPIASVEPKTYVDMGSRTPPTPTRPPSTPATESTPVESITQSVETITEPAESIGATEPSEPSLLDRHWRQVKQAVANINDEDQLYQLLEDEGEGRNRQSVIEAIESRISEL